MNDKDKEAFEKWELDYFGTGKDENCPDYMVHIKEAWQAACEYVRQKISLDQARSNRVFVDMARKLCEAEKELKEWKEAASSEANIVDELQAEHRALQEQESLAKTMYQLVKTENKKLREALEHESNKRKILQDGMEFIVSGRYYTEHVAEETLEKLKEVEKK